MGSDIGMGSDRAALLGRLARFLSLSSEPALPPQLQSIVWKSAGIGCENWDQMQTYTMMGRTLEECQLKCSMIDGCSTFNYQENDCNLGEQLGPRACLIYVGECVQEA